MDYTVIEKKAINSLLVRLMKVDGVTDLSEAITLFEINNHIKLSINDSTESLKMSYEECKIILREMDSYKKNVAKDYFNHMAKTDGAFDNMEKDMINDIFN
ncbi:MAG: hypothetical protein KAG84_07620 [Bacteroidales bacterium]|nr:hypothetical protein [Bacteroidales bacterium]